MRENRTHDGRDAGGRATQGAVADNAHILCVCSASPPPRADSHRVGFTRGGGKPARWESSFDFAFALVKSPRLIFADEPTSALDGANGQIVIDLLKRIAAEHNATVLGVTHDPRLLSHAHRVIHLEDGVVTRDERQNSSMQLGECHEYA